MRKGSELYNSLLMGRDTWPVVSEGDIDDPSDITLKTWPLPNTWLGISAEDQERANERIPDLLATPAAVRWVSAEPMLGPIDFTTISPNGVQMLNALSGYSTTPDYGGWPRLDWIVAGGESGADARPMHPAWARAIRDQCAQAGVAFFMKQMSGARKQDRKDIPDELQIREFPNA